MRVLRLGLGDGRSVDLHPAVSVVTGLTEAQRTALRRGFTAIGTGLSPAAPGLVEAHGLLLDASQDDLDLLDVGTTASSTVTVAADVPGAIPDEGAGRLRTSEQELLGAAAARADARHGLPRARAATAGPELAERARQLRARIDRHEQRDPEPLRVALDHVRDASRAHAASVPGGLAAALADVGLDTADLGLPDDELVRLAEDWLDERAREADWVVGAHVELQGIRRAPVGEQGAPSGGEDGGSADARRRAEHAARAHADAIVRADELREQLLVDHAPRPAADALQAHLLTRLAGHRPQRLAGAVPLLLDHVLTHLDDHDVAPLLDQVAGAAGPVQLVVADDNPAARSWAEAAGVQHAAVVSPSADAGNPA